MIREEADAGQHTEAFRPAPRWFALLAGAGLFVPAILFLAAAIAIPLAVSRHQILLALALSVVILWGAWLCVSTAWRLLRNRCRPDGGLVSPTFLRAAGVLFVAMPILSLDTGSWRSLKQRPALTAVQILLAFGAVAALFRLARAQRAKIANDSGRERNGPKSSSD